MPHAKFTSREKAFHVKTRYPKEPKSLENGELFFQLCSVKVNCEKTCNVEHHRNFEQHKRKQQELLSHFGSVIQKSLSQGVDHFKVGILKKIFKFFFLDFNFQVIELFLCSGDRS